MDSGQLRYAKPSVSPLGGSTDPDDDSPHDSDFRVRAACRIFPLDAHFRGPSPEQGQQRGMHLRRDVPLTCTGMGRPDSSVTLTLGKSTVRVMMVVTVQASGL